jgi:hypothetical protein
MDSSHVFLQRFEGNLTILPNRPSFLDYLQVLDDPSRDRLEKYIKDGEYRTWQACSMIKNRWKIEKTLMGFRNEVNYGLDQFTAMSSEESLFDDESELPTYSKVQDERSIIRRALGGFMF